MVSIQDFHYHLIMEFVFNLHFYRCFIYADFNISKISSNYPYFVNSNILFNDSIIPSIVLSSTNELHSIPSKNDYYIF